MSEIDGAMGRCAIAAAWIEISSGIAAGETTIRWYAEYCTADSRSIVADRRTEHEAISVALEWDLPVVHSRKSPGLLPETSAPLPKYLDLGNDVTAQ